MSTSSRIAPIAAAELLCTVAPTPELMQFVGNAISVYFRRVLAASSGKLIAFGLRPLVSPLVAEAALARVALVGYSPAYVYGLVAGDAEVAALALRAVRFYVSRYAQMDMETLSDEVGEAALHVKATARLLALLLEPTAIAQRPPPPRAGPAPVQADRPAQLTTLYATTL